MVTIRPTASTDVPNLAAIPTPLFYGGAGWLAIAAGTLIVIGQAIWWPFDQQGNVATSQNNIFNAGSVIYLAGFCVLMFALIGVHGRQAHKAGRLGTFGFSAALLGTMMLGGDLWFESFAVPWLAEGPLPEVLRSTPSILFALGCDLELLALRYWLGLVRRRKSAGTGLSRLDLRLCRRRRYRRLPGFAFPLGDSPRPGHGDTRRVVAARAAILGYDGKPRRAARHSSYVRPCSSRLAPSSVARPTGSRATRSVPGLSRVLTRPDLLSVNTLTRRSS